MEHAGEARLNEVALHMGIAPEQDVGIRLYRADGRHRSCPLASKGLSFACWSAA